MCFFVGFFQNTNFKEPTRVFTEEEKEDMKLRYYDEDIHRSAFVVPRFVKKVSSNVINSATVSFRQSFLALRCAYYAQDDFAFQSAPGFHRFLNQLLRITMTQLSQNHKVFLVVLFQLNDQKNTWQ